MVSSYRVLHPKILFSWGLLFCFVFHIHSQAKQLWWWATCKCWSDFQSMWHNLHLVCSRKYHKPWCSSKYIILNSLFLVPTERKYKDVVKGTGGPATFLRTLKSKLRLSDHWKAACLDHINLALYRISFIEFCSKVKLFNTKHHAWHSMSICWIKSTLGICFDTPGNLMFSA